MFLLLNYYFKFYIRLSEKPTLMKTFDKPAAIHLQN